MPQVATAEVWSWRDVDWSGHKRPKQMKASRAAQKAVVPPLPSPCPVQLREPVPEPHQAPPKPLEFPFGVDAVLLPPPVQSRPEAAPARPKPASLVRGVRLFQNAQDALFWAVSRSERLCPVRGFRPSQVFLVLGRLYRQRMLDRDHIKVLGIWAPLGHPPSASRGVERRLWDEAFQQLTPALQTAGLVKGNFRAR